MKGKKLKLLLLCVVLLLFGCAGAALGDWNEGDPHKMHYPQLPKEGGWDVALFSTESGSIWLADDWQCTQTGPISDIHFWVSWEDDMNEPIDGFSVRIWSDDPCGPGYSVPDELLWEREIYADDITVRYMPDDLQGWFDPRGGEVDPCDHTRWAQVNITDINDPYIQHKGEIYWLMIDMWGGGEIGWKESNSPHFRDNAVYYDSIFWNELIDPCTSESLDLAFVIGGLKWLQEPNSSLCGLHAHDEWPYDYDRLIKADDWLCEGGVVTDFHWWGSIEYIGSGLMGFHLSIHANDDPCCLPADPALWEADIAIGSIAVTPTGVNNICGDEIIEYKYVLPPEEYFEQEIGNTYWFNVCALSNDPLNCCVWHWQEAGRSPVPILCPAAEKMWPDPNIWSSIYWDPDYSDMAFAITSIRGAITSYNWSPNSVGVWSNVTMWEDQDGLPAGSKPDGSAEVKIRYSNSVCTLNSVENWPVTNNNRVRVYKGATLNIVPGGSLIGPGWFRSGTSEGPGTVNQTGGLLKLKVGRDSSKLIVGDNAGSAGSTYTISGGTITYDTTDGGAGQLCMGDRGGSGTFTVVGSGPVIKMKALHVGGLNSSRPATGNLEFKIGASGVSPIDVNHTTLDPGGAASTANLLVSFTANPPTGDIVLVRNSNTGPTSMLGIFDTANGSPAPEGAFVHDYTLTYQYDADGDGANNDIALIPVSKWLQRPDLSENGIDVDAVHWDPEPWKMQVLADDFDCTRSGPITDIYIWGSWFNDKLPEGGPNDVEFWIEIFSDNPVGPNGWSEPNERLWEWDFWPANEEFDVYPYAQDLNEGYYSPCTGFYEPNGDTICWLYHFHIDPCDAFIQQQSSDPCNPSVYWLVVQALPTYMDPNVRFGWKTSIDRHRDDAVWKEGWSGTAGPWNELRYPPGHPFDGNSIDLAFAITTPEGKPLVPHTKWSQPPIEIDPNLPEPTYYGWDEESWRPYPSPSTWPIVADDFRCLGTMPVTSIHWWGSYVGWDGNEPPQSPSSGHEEWRIRFWSNVNAGMPVSFSWPEELLWEIVIPEARVQIEKVGRDYDPRYGSSETCFQYHVELDPCEVFWQDDFNDQTMDDIYWMSIEALDHNTIQGYHWGWKTRPWHWMDDAVTMNVNDMNVGDTITSSSVTPIIYDGNSFDVSFELNTDTDYIKWEQHYTGLRHWPHYEDEKSMRGEDFRGVADDWRCLRRTPVTAIVWWGSYIGYGYEAYSYDPCDPCLPVPPSAFELNIWTDSPAGSDPCYAFSHPNDAIWEYWAYDYDEVLVGYDKHPHGGPNEPVFRYSVRLPEDVWFHQPDYNGVFWFSVGAWYDDINSVPNYKWGWTNHKHVFNDNAVAEYQDPNGGGAAWHELYDQTGKSADMSFILFTDPNECSTCADYDSDMVNFVDFADFADDWRWVGPAGGYNNSDLDCNGVVDFKDLRIFCMQWLDFCEYP